MKFTLLEMTQRILSALDGDEVNTISDTVEAEQVSLIIQGVYYDIASSMELPEHETLFDLVPSADNTKPTLMTLPDKATDLQWIKYDHIDVAETQARWRYVDFTTLEEFILRQGALEDESNASNGSMNVVTDDGTFEFLYRNDKQPSWYTILGENIFIFDSYLATLDTTLQASKTMCFGTVYPDFTLSDTFVPDLDQTQFAYLLNKAKERAFSEIKQVENREAAREARQQRVSSQRRKRNVPFGGEVTRIRQYGRK